MQLQLDPNIPTNLSEAELRNFKSFLDIALDSLTAAGGAPIFTLGNNLLVSLALIVIVLQGAKIAFGGGIQPWELVRVVIGIWIPWVMLQFYTVIIPGVEFTFPHMIVAAEIGSTNCWLTTLFRRSKSSLQNCSRRLPPSEIRLSGPEVFGSF